MMNPDEINNKDAEMESLLLAFPGLISIQEEEDATITYSDDDDDSSDLDDNVDYGIVQHSLVLFCRLMEEQYHFLLEDVESDLLKYHDKMNDVSLSEDSRELFDQTQMDISRYRDRINMIIVTNAEFQYFVNSTMMDLGVHHADNIIDDELTNSTKHAHDDDYVEL
jgi:hypothetical protein